MSRDIFGCCRVMKPDRRPHGRIGPIRCLQQSFLLKNVTRDRVGCAVHADDNETQTLGQVSTGIHVWHRGAFIVVRVGGQLMHLEAVIVVFFHQRKRRKPFEKGVVRDAADFEEGVIDFKIFAAAVAAKGGNASGFVLLETVDPGFVICTQARGPALHDFGDPRVIGEAVSAVRYKAPVTIERLAHYVVDVPSRVVQLGCRPVGGPPAAHDKDAFAGIAPRLIVAGSDERQVFAGHVEFPGNAPLPHRVDQVPARVAAGGFRSDCAGGELKTDVVRSDSGHAFVCAYMIIDVETARYGVIIVQEVTFRNQGVGVQMNLSFAAVAIERIEGEFHPLPR